jgi:hypothetical protein
VDGNPWPALIGLFNVDGSGPSLGELSSWRPSDDPLVVICAVTRRDPQFGPAIGEIVARGVRLAFDADLSDENAMTDNHVSFPYLAELLGADSHDVRR